MKNEMKTRTVAKVTMHGTWTVVYHADKQMYFINHRYYDILTGKNRTFKFAEVATLAAALHTLYRAAESMRE